MMRVNLYLLFIQKKMDGSYLELSF